jgi:transcriptional regulator with XRE-family HTH domain
MLDWKRHIIKYDKNLTQKQLAVKIGMKRQEISKIEQ